MRDVKVDIILNIMVDKSKVESNVNYILLAFSFILWLYLLLLVNLVGLRRFW